LEPLRLVTFNPHHGISSSCSPGKDSNNGWIERHHANAGFLEDGDPHDRTVALNVECDGRAMEGCGIEAAEIAAVKYQGRTHTSSTAILFVCRKGIALSANMVWDWKTNASATVVIKDRTS
jgi:hypothetical protein